MWFCQLSKNASFSCSSSPDTPVFLRSVCFARDLCYVLLHRSLFFLFCLLRLFWNSHVLISLISFFSGFVFEMGFRLSLLCKPNCKTDFRSLFSFYFYCSLFSAFVCWIAINRLCKLLFIFRSRHVTERFSFKPPHVSILADSGIDRRN